MNKTTEHLHIIRQSTWKEDCPICEQIQKLNDFIEAFDKWAVSVEPDNGDGVLFVAMVETRQELGD